MDNLTIALCICIGTGVPWLIAIHSENGARQLIGNSVLGLVGIRNPRREVRCEDCAEGAHSLHSPLLRRA